MTVFLRALPGLAALCLVVLAVFFPSAEFNSFLYAGLGQQAFFTASRMGSVVLYVLAPIVFALVGRRTSCHRHPVKAGTILLSMSVLPLVAANIMYLATRSPQDPGADIGGALLQLLGLSASVITSLVFTVLLPLTGPADADRMDTT